MSNIHHLVERLIGPSEAEVRAQYASLKQQIPVMYLLMAINVAFLAIVTHNDISPSLGLWVPFALSVLLLARAITWIARQHRQPPLDVIRRQLLGTLALSAVLSAAFGAWGLALFHEADPLRGTSIALYIFVGSIGCCYCLQALPLAARFVMFFGAMPVTLRLLLSNDWYMVGIGVTFLLVAGVLLRTLRATRLAFQEILRSRSELAALLAELQKTQEHHRFSVELNPQIPWIGGPGGEVTEISPRWAALTGRATEDAIGDGWSSSVHPDDFPQIAEMWRDAVQTGGASVADGRYRLRLADESYRWMRARARPRLDEHGRVLMWYGNLDDIHDQVVAETALRDSEERYRLAAQAANDIIWDWSHDDRRLYWADGVENVFGYPTPSSGTSIEWWLERVHPDDMAGVLQLFTDLPQRRADGWSHEYRFRAADGTYRHLAARGRVVRDAHGTTLRAIGALQDITEAKQAADELRRAAYHDPLTGLPNRKMFADKLDAALVRAGDEGECVAVIVLDIDGFKSINDGLGHAAGDMVLQTVASRIAAHLPPGGTLARLGGDEYAIILPHMTPQDARADTVTGIIGGAGQSIVIGESAIDVSISAGAAMWPKDGASAEDVVKSADLALYAAKADGSGTVRGFVVSMREKREARDRMLRDARDSLRDDRIIPFYQPKVSFATGHIIGFEALLRWHHHRRGLQPPHTIKAAFEDAAISTQLTDRMIDRVLADMSRWLDNGVAFGRIAINGSPADFRRNDFAERILTKLHDAGLAPTLLELEVTETVFLEQEATNVDRALRTLAAAGVTIALDDFGTGYASLTHLQQFPVNALKIDRSFISRLDRADTADSAIVDGIIDIARKMRIKTVAEGVETAAQADHLRALGCDFAQGFLFSRPVSSLRVEPLIAGWRNAGGADEYGQSRSVSRD